MHYFIFVAASLIALSGCSKPPEKINDTADSSATTQNDVKAVESDNAAFANAAKKDFAALFVAEASEACASVKGQEFPDPKSGSAMQYSASGQISWGAGNLDYVKEPGAKIMFINARNEQTFSFGADIYDIEKSDRIYIAGLGQLKGGSLNATVTDETKAINGNSNMTTGNICVGKTPPPLVSQGAWQLAVKYAQVPKTTMLCMQIGQPGMTEIIFSFDGKSIQAGDSTFTQADSEYSETFSIDPQDDKTKIMYKVDKSNGSGVALGLSQEKNLAYAEFEATSGNRMLCSAK